MMKVLIIEDNLHPFSCINGRLALDKRVQNIDVYNYLSEPVTEKMIYTISKKNTGHSFELYWVKENNEFLHMINDIHLFDVIILDFQLKIGNSKIIANKLIEIKYNGIIIPHSSKHEHNDTLRSILGIKSKNFCKTTGQVAYHLIEQLEDK